MKKLLITSVLSACIIMTACSGEYIPPAEQEDTVKTNQLQSQASATIGMPKITNFTEKALATKLLELRDNPKLLTYAYLQGLDGKLVCLGKGIGYGLPYSTQVTNPEKSLDDKSLDGGDTVLPQAEPNALYMPESAAATWYMMIDEKGDTKPIYIEPDVIVSPIKIQSRAVTAQCE